MGEGHRSILNRVGNALSLISDEVEALGATLCGDPAVVAKHLTILQSIDLIAQQQRALSALLLGDDFERGVEDIGLEVLRNRLRG